MFERFKKRIETGFEKIKVACQERRIKTVGLAERRVGRILQKNSRAAKLFDVHVEKNKNGKIEIDWTQKQMHSDWVALSHGC